MVSLEFSPHRSVIRASPLFVIATPSLLVILNGVKNLPPAQGEPRVAISEIASAD